MPRSPVARPFLSAGFLLLLCSRSGVAQPAATAQYGDFVGETVVFENVEEQGDVLFNEPVVVGDRLVFNPNASDFEVQAFGGDEQALSGNIVTNIAGNPGRALTGITVGAGGTASFFGFGTFPVSSVRAEVTISAGVIEIDGEGVDGQPVRLQSVTETVINLEHPGRNVINQTWTGQGRLDVAAAARDAGFEGDVTFLNLVVNTVLFATSESGSTSRIDLTGFETVTISLPEPSSALLIAGAASGLCLRRRRVT